MLRLTPEQIAGAVTCESDAVEIIEALKRRFNLCGIEFAPSDVGGYVEAVQQDIDFPQGYEGDLVRLVTGSEHYCKVVERMADVGTFTVDEGVNSVFRSAVEQAGFFRALLWTAPLSGPRCPRIESPAFRTAVEAHEWGSARLGRRLAEVRREEGVTELARETDSTSRLSHLSLVIFQRDGLGEPITLDWSGPDAA